MVQMSILGKLRQSPEKAAAAAAAAVIEDELEEEHGPLNKRSKPSPNQQRGSETGMVPQSIPYILLDEPSPLGLRLRKGPSLLDLIQMRLSLGCSASSSCITSSEYIDTGKKELQSTAVSGIPDKLKASNFRASLLKIGSWECISRYEGDLVAKCYYAKHKLVWEVLDGGLKNKIELQWSDIASLKATCPENGPGTLDIVLAQQPLFFRETNPQPRKHTLWQATSDFTNGQASTHRRHFLQCPQGLLNKHFEKLIQCDPRLNSLSQQSEIILEPPFFEPRLSCVFENPVEDSKCHGFDLKGGYHDPLSAGFQDPLSSSSEPPSASSSCKNEIMRAPFGRGDNDVPLCKALSPSSAMDTEVVDKNLTTSRILNDWDQIKVPGLRLSMSMSDLVNHIGHCISGHTTPGNPLLPTNSSLNKSVLEELTQYLLSDSQVTSANDEQSLMSRVNSLCCLIQHKDPQTVQLNTSDDADESDDSDDEKDSERKKVDTNNDASGCKLGMSRKDSYGELLLNLPRIASMPQFLFNIAEDSENQAR